MILEYATSWGPVEFITTLSLPSDDTHAAEYLYVAVQDGGYDSVDQVLVTDGEAGRSNSVVFAPRPFSMAVASNMRGYITGDDDVTNEIYESYCCVEELLPASGVVPSLRTSTATVTLTLSVTPAATLTSTLTLSVTPTATLTSTSTVTVTLVSVIARPAVDSAEDSSFPVAIPIVIGVVLLLALCGVVAFFVFRRRGRRVTPSSDAATAVKSESRESAVPGLTGAPAVSGPIELAERNAELVTLMSILVEMRTDLALHAIDEDATLTDPSDYTVATARQDLTRLCSVYAQHGLPPPENATAQLQTLAANEDVIYTATGLSNAAASGSSHPPPADRTVHHPAQPTTPAPYTAGDVSPVTPQPTRWSCPLPNPLTS